MNQLRTLIVTVQNKPGVLFKIAGLIRKRRFNIESLTVSRTDNPEVSRFTIVVHTDEATIEKMGKQLTKIMEVLHVADPAEDELVSRELALIKLAVPEEEAKQEATELASQAGARLISSHFQWLVFEMTGDEAAIDAFYESMRKFVVIEFVRTGRTALFK